jgi:DNA-binding cell septation regulator SpoVG
MKVSNIKFNFFPKEGITIALGQFTIEGVLTINFALKDGQHGKFISLGNDRKGKDGKYYASVFASKQYYSELVETIDKAYQALATTQPTVEVAKPKTKRKVKAKKAPVTTSEDILTELNNVA